MPSIGPLEIVVVIVILLVIFGPKRIPELGRSIGQGMRNFKESVTGRDRGDDAPELEQSATGGRAVAEEQRAARPAPDPRTGAASGPAGGSEPAAETPPSEPTTPPRT
jgi:sec-independent protein translocase protein TatA